MAGITRDEVRTEIAAAGVLTRPEVRSEVDRAVSELKWVLALLIGIAGMIFHGSAETRDFDGALDVRLVRIEVLLKVLQQDMAAIGQGQRGVTLPRGEP
ncbi:MAG: hypothetical protein Q8P18_21480 [Pseudomonadota bacterium]|nr:hypothetical protein [Pseudomonadota bacterium]